MDTPEETELFMEKNKIDELARLAYFADKETRSDLAKGYIANENDYTSNFSGALRRNINAHSTNFSATSFVLSSTIERLCGCDATIIIQSNNKSKILFFEAKYPRISQTTYDWDYAQTATGLSHFSDQLDRQALCNRAIHIFEMFYCEYNFNEQPDYMHDEVSSCIWHQTALSFKDNRPSPNGIWNRSDLVDLLHQDHLTIKNIILNICSNPSYQTINVTDIDSLTSNFHLSGEILLIRQDNTSQSPFR